MQARGDHAFSNYTLAAERPEGLAIVQQAIAINPA
jgi:hypothetical protein